MSTMPSSTAGSTVCSFETSWTPVEKIDTRPEITALLHRRKQALTDEERLANALRWCHQLFGITYHVLELANPGAPHYELIALWNERMYRGKVPDALLDRAMAEIRRCGALGLPPFDK